MQQPKTSCIPDMSRKELWRYWLELNAFVCFKERTKTLLHEKQMVELEIAKRYEKKINMR